MEESCEFELGLNIFFFLHGRFVGRDISNFAINLFKAGTGSGTGDSISEEV